MTPSMTILYVDRPIESAAFYQKLFGLAPVELQETFGLFALPSGLMLGLWQRDGVKPAASFTGGGCELVIRVENPDEVDQIHEAWSALGADVIQAPAIVDFGRTFAIADPDGHRLRVFNPPARA